MNRFQVMALTGAAAGMTALSSVGAASAQDAVQWRVEDGGNGHWYQAIPTSGLRWPEARDLCVGLGGHLVTMSSAAEDAFARTLTPDVTDTGFWIGAIRQQGVTCSATTAWQWVDGSPWRYVGWNETQPQCWNQGQIYVVVVRGSYTPGWHDFDDTTDIARAVIEWSADCNSDGIVDYGQIRAGELVDVNANNIPDCCEQSVSCSPCPGDIDESGTVNGVDLAAILAVWGSDGGKYPRADTNNDGEVNGADLATVLSSWGSCE